MFRIAERIEDSDGQAKPFALHPDDAGASIAAALEDVREVSLGPVGHMTLVIAARPRHVPRNG